MVVIGRVGGNDGPKTQIIDRNIIVDKRDLNHQHFLRALTYNSLLCVFFFFVFFVLFLLFFLNNWCNRQHTTIGKIMDHR